MKQTTSRKRRETAARWVPLSVLKELARKGMLPPPPVRPGRGR
jgi:hypothetical protein